MNLYRFLITLLISTTIIWFAASAQAENLPIDTTKIFMQNTPNSLVPPAPDLDAKAYVLIDADSGQILAEKNMQDRLPPASLTKLMTLYVTFQALKSGQIQLTDKAQISKDAWKTGGSRMFVRANTAVPIEDLIHGIIVDSGNDATVALAEYIAGSQQAFVALMNRAAQSLGMKNTHYSDVNGLPIPDHYASAEDLGILTLNIIKQYPEYYPWFSQKYFTFAGIKQSNRNRLLWQDSSVDGLKTGHTDAAGFCLIASAKRDNMRLIAVVMGAPTDSTRASFTERLLNYGFRFFETHKLYAQNQPIQQATVWFANSKQVDLGLTEPLYITIPKGQYQLLKANIALTQRLHAPIIQGQSYGTLNITYNQQPLMQKPLIALQNDPKGGLWVHLRDYVALGFAKIF